MEWDKDDAKRLLVHYFKKAIPEWHDDMTSEVEAIIDYIVDAAVEAVKAKSKKNEVNP